jgi:hypothetical protein
VFNAVKVAFGWRIFGNILIVLRISVIAKVMAKFTYLEMKISKNLKVIFDAMNFLLMSIFSVVVLLILFMLIFSIIGMNLFSEIPFQYMINEQYNFQNIFRAFLLMFTTLTGFNWEDIMYECSAEIGDYVYTEHGVRSTLWKCDDAANATELKELGPRGCGNIASVPFFVSFILLVKLMVTN